MTTAPVGTEATATGNAPGAPAAPRSGWWAIGMIGGITVGVLLTMLVVLTRGADVDTGRAVSRGAASDPGLAAPPGTDHTAGTVPRPGLRGPVADLDDQSIWTTPMTIPGATCAGPVLLGSMLGVMCDNRHMYGFDLETGEQRWDTVIDHDTPTFVNPVTAGGGHLFLYARTEEIVAVDATSGAEVWRATPGLVLGLAATDTQVLLVGAGHAIALDPATGQTQWSTPIPDDRIRGTGVRIDVGPTDLVATLGHTVASYDLATGAERWHTDAPGDITFVKAAGTDVVTMGADGTVIDHDAATGAKRWDLTGHFGGTQQLLAGFDPDHVFASSTREVGSLSRRDGTVVWSATSADSFQQPDSIDRAALTDGHLMARGNGRVWQVDPANGAAVASRLMNSASPGLVHHGTLYILEASVDPRAPWRLESFTLV